MTNNLRLPDNGKALPLKWIYTTKPEPKRYYHTVPSSNGSTKILSNLWCELHWYLQSSRQVWIRLEMSKQLGLIIHTMDVDTAFLNANLDEHIWVQIPTGTRLATGDDGIYKLFKSLYGLKQASRCWNILMSAYLIKKGSHRWKLTLVSISKVSYLMWTV
jgi:Reverse transcriptase (RNA-dependent DNA polymerase)